MPKFFHDGVNMKESLFINIGASNHSKNERQPEDYYATEPIAGKLLLEVEPDLSNIWETACGEGHLAKVFNEVGKLRKATDLIDRGYGSVEDFLLHKEPYHNGDIVTNPPYKYAQEFVEHALSKVDEGRKVCMFLKSCFLKGKKEKNFLLNIHLKQYIFQVLVLIVLKMVILKLIIQVLLLMRGMCGKKAIEVKRL